MADRAFRSSILHRLPSIGHVAATFAASQRAVRKSFASPFRAPTSCTPIGSLSLLSSSGNEMHGMPQSVHRVQNAGSPVLLMPLGAALGAAGVKIAS